ncbi:hypothetical protein H5T51_05570, partial [Candidatus Bathyarchaeota archaeon]|nr:hypothetical protein [Candidatus Bathyarchaeota archaeon]
MKMVKKRKYLHGKVITLLVMLLISFAVPIFSTSFADNDDFWEKRRPMPTPMSGHRAAVVNGKIYVIGNKGTYEYDPATDTWTAKKPMPTPRLFFGVAVYQNKIYCIGGQVGQQEPTGVNEVYDPLTDT